jgi:hypothetical protein
MKLSSIKMLRSSIHVGRTRPSQRSSGAPVYDFGLRSNRNLKPPLSM